jgi:GntR family transcriptional regulator
MLLKPNPTSSVPVYVQLMEQVKHAVETGALRPGDQLPTIRKVAEDLVINPNTVAKAYRELEHEGIIELRQGAGAFVANSGRAKMQTDKRHRARQIIEGTVAKLVGLGLTEEEMRRWFEAELLRLRETSGAPSENTKR